MISTTRDLTDFSMFTQVKEQGKADTDELVTKLEKVVYEVHINIKVIRTLISILHQSIHITVMVLFFFFRPMLSSRQKSRIFKRSLLR